jgi:hypothetical protein
MSTNIFRKQIGDYTFISGQRITCTIKGHQIIDAVIYLKTGTSRCWICHNNPELVGSEADNLYGYLYSWSFVDYRPEEDGVYNILPILSTIDIKKFTLSNKMIKFFSFINRDDLKIIFEFKIKGVFEDFTNLSESENSGFVVLSDGKKNVEIKVSRLIRQITNSISQIDKDKTYGNIFKLSDHDIEKIYNKYISFQNCAKSEVEFLSGEKILEGYRRENYILGSTETVLHKSCMVDKLDFLKIYTENPNQVKMAVLKFEDKIAARCLIWKDVNGKEYFDRIYYQFDWLENLLSDKLSLLGYKYVKQAQFSMIQLDKWEFDYYPYLDNFYHFDKTEGRLLMVGNSNVLRNTNGTF